MYNRILVPVDLSHKTQLPQLMEAVQRLVQPDGSTDVWLLYVDKSREHTAGNPQIDATISHNHNVEVSDQLTALLQQYTGAAFTIGGLVRQGTVHDQILAEISYRNADAVVMMARKPGLSSYFIGSSAERVVRHASCSVFVVRD